MNVPPEVSGSSTIKTKLLVFLGTFLIVRGGEMFFPSEESMVWETEKGDKLLVIPMRKGTELVGCQLINEQGEKKFLYGQTSKGATFTIGAEGTPIFCEGYATGLSIRDVMRSINMPYNIHICFSANKDRKSTRLNSSHT